MNRFLFLALLVLAACSPEIRPAVTAELPTPLPTETAKLLAVPLPTKEPLPTVPTAAKVLAVSLYVRSEPSSSSAAVGHLEAGSSVVILSCAGPWCQLEEPAGWVWRGCLSDNPDGLKCEAKP